MPPSFESQEGLGEKSPAPGQPDSRALTEEPRPPDQEVRETRPPEDGPSADLKPRLRLSIDPGPVWQSPIRDHTPDGQGPLAPGPAEPDASPGVSEARAPVGGEHGAPIRLSVGPPSVGEIPRPQVFADEPGSQDLPARELPVQEPLAQDPPQDDPAAHEPGRSIAARMEIARQGDQPEEPEGEGAQVTDSSPPGEAVLEDDTPVAGPTAAGAVDPRKAADRVPGHPLGRCGPVELRLAPSRPVAAPTGERIKVWVGPTDKALVGEGPAARGGRLATRPAPAQKPIHLSLKFPVPNPAATPEALRAQKSGPARAASGASSKPEALGRRLAREPVIVARLGTGAGSVKRSSPGSDAARSGTAARGEGPSLTPIRLTIKGSTVVFQSGGEGAVETAPAALSGAPDDSKRGGSPLRNKPADTGSPSQGSAGRAARAAARLNQWSLLGVKPGQPPLIEASRPSPVSPR